MILFQKIYHNVSVDNVIHLLNMNAKMEFYWILITKEKKYMTKDLSFLNGINCTKMKYIIDSDFLFLKFNKLYYKLTI